MNTPNLEQQLAALTAEQRQKAEVALAFIAGQPIEWKYSCPGEEKWLSTNTLSGLMTNEHRTAPKPDSFADLKAAHAAGKRIEFFNCLQQWQYAENPFWAEGTEYRIAPWTLADHMRRFFPAWAEKTMPLHRTDWTEDMLPDGWRPLLLDELLKLGDEFLRHGTDWKIDDRIDGAGVQNDWLPRRTRRPLPSPPKMVPLGPEDVPPGSTLRVNFNDKGWESVREVREQCLILASGANADFTWLRKYILIHRPGDNNPDGSPAWRKCEKEAK